MRNVSYGTRRELLGKTVSATAGVVLLGETIGRAQTATTGDQITPTEDLMREHGVLKRLMLIYEEASRRIDAGRELPVDALRDTAVTVRAFIEDYHERLEEDYVFPRFERAAGMADLTRVLLRQHQAGRRLTDLTMPLTTPPAMREPENRRRLADTLRQFIRMCEPHQAREDTVLFPAFHQVVSPQEFDALGDTFEKQENELFGEGGFETTVRRVEGIEKALGVYDLAQFTAI
jgi:hemerythrin-like domain-containing protein